MGPAPGRDGTPTLATSSSLWCWTQKGLQWRRSLMRQIPQWLWQDHRLQQDLSPIREREIHGYQEPYTSLRCSHRMTDGAADLLNLEAISQIVFNLVIFFLFHRSQSLSIACITGNSLKTLLPSTRPCPQLNAMQLDLWKITSFFFLILSKLCMSRKISKYCLFQMGSWSRLLWRG